MNRVRAHAYKPKRLRNGKRQVAKYWRMRWQVVGEPNRRDVSLGVVDKQVAEKLVREFISEKELELSGILPSRPLREGAIKRLADHLEDFLADMAARKRDADYVRHLRLRINKLIAECGWIFPADVTPDSFISWRSMQTKAAKTLNEYLNGASALLNWMTRKGRIPANPLGMVEKVQSSGEAVRIRRALADDEAERLLLASGPRRVVYMAAMLTGLRRAELAALQWGDVHLDGPRPFLAVRASTTKNHKSAMIGLRDDLATELRKLRPADASPADWVLRKLMPGMDRMRADLKSARIEAIDAQNRRIDFHSLRKTFNTNLSRAGVSEQVQMEAMRVTDRRLIDKTYLDRSLLATAEAVESLPRFGAGLATAEKAAQNHAQSLVQTCPNVSPVVHDDESRDEPKVRKTTEKTVVCPQLSLVVGDQGKTRQVGLEPTTSRLTAGCSTIELLPNGSPHCMREG